MTFAEYYFTAFYFTTAVLCFVSFLGLWRVAMGEIDTGIVVAATLFAVIPLVNVFFAAFFGLSLLSEAAGHLAEKWKERKYMKTIEIKNSSGRVLFRHTTTRNTMSKTLEAAMKEKVRLCGAVFVKQALRDINFSCKNLSTVKFIGCDLRGACFNQSILTAISFEDSNLSGVYFSRVVLNDAIFLGAKFGRLTVTGRRPFMQIGPIGSRGDSLLCFNTNKGIYFSTGCFFGSLKEFEAAVRRNGFHPNHCDDYLETIDYVRSHFTRWNTPQEE